MESVYNPLGALTRLLVPALFPAGCCRCGTELPAALGHCCDDCLAAILEPGYQVLPGDPGPRLKVVSLFPYEELGRELVGRVKFHGSRRLLARLANHLAREAGQFGVAGPGPVFCPVPSMPVRSRERGGNPASWLAGELARTLGGTQVQALRRVRQGKDQKTLDRAGRLVNLKQCFQAVERRCRPMAGLRPWIVDDVVTTGATLEYCALELLHAGVVPAGAIVLARTPLAGEWIGLPDLPGREPMLPD